MLRAKLGSFFIHFLKVACISFAVITGLLFAIVGLEQLKVMVPPLVAVSLLVFFAIAVLAYVTWDNGDKL